MVTFRIPDMTCGHCAGTIARAIGAVDGVASIEVDVPGRLVSVTGNAAGAELLQAIQEAGYTPEVLAGAATRRAPAAGGCCCASRKAAPVDARQGAAAAASPCCGC